ncbi:hypothetical protein HD554DRAFT_1979755, partial [Boletus coccyginus]
VFLFFQLFMRRFPQYTHLPLHATGEGYWGGYTPHIVVGVRQGLVSTHLASAMYGNRLVD